MTASTDESNTPALNYRIGKAIHLKICTSNQKQTELHVEIKQQKRPWTLSCGMSVELQDASDSETISETLRNQSEAFLKMFDRRFAEQIRQDNGIDTWSADIEQKFLTALASGKAEEFLCKLQTMPNFQRDTEDDWDAAENEVYLAAKLRKCFTSEIATYNHLREYQGKVIPRFLASVVLDMLSSNAALTTQQQELYKQQGILLQYLPGFSLSTLADNAPESSWQAIVDQAIQIVHVLGDHDILNADVRPDNFIVVPKDDTYQVFMIDFGQCRFRREDESDAEWGRAKWRQDEEGAVGYVMKSRLKKVGFELKFEPSWRYLAWAPGEDD
ncbi:uncharacterized protein FTJAE_14225 [Fusarium tjaetaba]|uniref:Protein kinase domain-containing protein n=1 Tax=Fusarium tjaetaba TaxID=1567544 RepID=A0A8H5QAU4_9HYPO|nr:uncharacterized protein FTJAE_14225 [Fusarium tjaetaba]KAF5611152.1 hypothetical protein FTJAE_14225 [Fusarium tjaetaba]